MQALFSAGNETIFADTIISVRYKIVNGVATGDHAVSICAAGRTQNKAAAYFYAAANGITSYPFRVSVFIIAPGSQEAFAAVFALLFFISQPRQS